MAPPSIQSYVSKLQQLLDDDSETYSDWDLALQFSLHDMHVYMPEAYRDPPRREYVRRLRAPFDELVFLHLQVCYYVLNQKIKRAYEFQCQLVQHYNKECLQKMKEENWFLAIVKPLCVDLRKIALSLDQTGSKEDMDDSCYYEKCASFIMECYRSCVSDNRTALETSKRLAILNLTNHLFQIYYKINKLNLLKPLVRAIDNCGEMYHEFSMSDKVTYQYFTGRKHMFDCKFKEAETALSFAFRNCPSECLKNKRLILMYLVPVKMFLGHMPTGGLLEKYGLEEFSEIALSIKQGNAVRFEEALVANEQFFIDCGVFLLLEKLKIIVYRTLFKKVCAILGIQKIPIDSFVAALKFQNDDVDSDEVACLLANLIFQGKIRGYLSHQHQKLVISKENAFPRLSSVV